MNLYKIAVSLLVTAAPAAARLSSDEKDSSAVMRELMTKFDSMQSEVASLKADNKALKSKVASLEKRRGLMPDLDGMELPDLDGLELPDLDGFELPKELTDILDVDVDPSSGGGPLKGILTGILLQLYGLKRCVGFGIDGPTRRLSGERQLPGYGGETACFFGGQDIDEVFIEANFEDGFIDLDADGIGDFSFFRVTQADELLSEINFGIFSSQSASIEEKKAKLKEKKAEFKANMASMKAEEP